jgi:hypothetical protein
MKLCRMTFRSIRVFLVLGFSVIYILVPTPLGHALLYA